MWKAYMKPMSFRGSFEVPYAQVDEQFRKIISVVVDALYIVVGRFGISA